MRLKALTLRILKQLLHDKRTMALIFLAPLFIMTLIYLIMNTDNSALTIGTVNADAAFIEQLEAYENAEVTVRELAAADIDRAVKNEEVAGAVEFTADKVLIYVSGADPAAAALVQAAVSGTLAQQNKSGLEQNLGNMQDDLSKLQQQWGDLQTLWEQARNYIPGLNAYQLPDLGDLTVDSLDISETTPDVVYVIGEEDWTIFDRFGSQFVGIIVYFLVFIMAGINFLTERTSGTLEKMLSTPVRCWEIVTGYILAFGVLALVQSVLITLFVVYVLGISVAGSIWLVLLISLLTALNALALGILLSTLANSEFQMLQFIPVVILPQIFLCGIFTLSGVWELIGHFVPLYYTSEALTEIILKGSGLGVIWTDILVLAGLSLVFMLLNMRLLKKKRWS